MLAALQPDDSSDDIHTKVKITADFPDIWLTRRVWHCWDHGVLFSPSHDVQPYEVDSLNYTDTRFNRE